MVVDAKDPITGTNWFDADDLGGTAMTWIVAILGLTGLFLAFAIANNTFVPAARGVVSALPFIDAGAGSGGIPVGRVQGGGN